MASGLTVTVLKSLLVFREGIKERIPFFDKTMTEIVRTESAPSPAQMDSWRRLWDILLSLEQTMPTQTDTSEAESTDEEGSK